MSKVGFPLLLIPLAIYNIIVFLMPGVSLGDPLFRVMLVSGAQWPVTLGEILLAIGVLLLLLEVVRSARASTKYLTDHLLSLIVFGAAAAEFLLWPKFASSTFFLLALMALADFIAGIALRSRRHLQPASAKAVRRAAGPAEAPTTEPRFEPQVMAPEPSAPAAALPSAASVAEAVLTDHPTAKPSQGTSATGETSPNVPSPELQPGSRVPPSSETPQH